MDPPDDAGLGKSSSRLRCWPRNRHFPSVLEPCLHCCSLPSGPTSVLIYFGGAHFFGGSIISIFGHSFFTSGSFGHSFFISGGFGHSCFGGSIAAFFAAQDCFSCGGGGGGGC